MIQELVKDLVQKEYDIRIDKDTRKAEYVEARAVYYKLLRKHTYLSLDRIGKSVGRDHAGVINAINRLDGWLTYDDRMIRVYSEISEKVQEQVNKLEGVEIFKSLEELYENKYIKLAKQYNEMLVKYDFIKNKLARFHPHILQEEEFNISDKITERLMAIKTPDNKLEIQVNEEERV